MKHSPSPSPCDRSQTQSSSSCTKNKTSLINVQSPVQPKNSCSKDTSPAPDTTLALLVKQYREGGAYEGQEYDIYQWYGDQSLSLEDAIDRAFRSEHPNGKLHGHQYRIGRQRLKRLASISKNHTQRFRDARTWDEIYSIVGDIIAQVRGAATLTQYDIANRIGGYLRYEQTIVRVHAGAEKGAAALGLRIQDGTVALEDLPPELQTLGAMHTENFLCIYKDHLRQPQLH